LPAELIFFVPGQSIATLLVRRQRELTRGAPMQFLMLIKIANNADYEAGKPPSEELQAAMGEVMAEWSQTGAMVSAAGLKPPSQATRVRLDAGNVMLTDGPFAEAKEVIGGFFILEAKDKATAVEMTRRFVELHGTVLGKDFQLECEVRQIEA
jgi:hypothetical protein